MHTGVTVVGFRRRQLQSWNGWESESSP